MSIVISAITLMMQAAPAPVVHAPPPAAPSNIGKKAVLRGGGISAADYPAEALLNLEEGTTVVRYVISTDGTVSSCEVTRSSGSTSLDSATCALITRRFKFTPAQDANGNAIVETRTNPVRWQLPKQEPESLAVYHGVSTQFVDSDGTFGACATEYVGEKDKRADTCRMLAMFLLPPDGLSSSFPSGGNLVSISKLRLETDSKDPPGSALPVNFRSTIWKFDVAPDGSVSRCEVSDVVRGKALSDEAKIGLVRGCRNQKFMPLPKGESGRSYIREISIGFRPNKVRSQKKRTKAK